MESCRSFDSFELNASLKIILVYFSLVTRSISSCCFCGLVLLLFCSLLPNVKVLSFWSEIIKRLLGETHVFGRTFIFLYFSLYWWSFDFAPACGRTVIVSDHVTGS